MKIVADENIPFVNDFFADLGEVSTLAGRQMQARDVADADVLLVRSVTPVNAQLLQDSSVKFVGTCTIGVDHLDQSFLQRAGIVYASAPGCNAGGVVQYDLTALALLRPQWRELSIGVIGSGNVGGRLCQTLAALGVEHRAYDPFLDSTQNPALGDLEQVLACDIVCMHAPFTRGGPHPSHHLLSASNLKQLKPGALLLNGGRGGTIDNQALLEVLESGADLQVVLDVWEDEPEPLMPLLQRVEIATPHIAGYSFEGKLNGTAMIYTALAGFLGIDEEQSRSKAAALTQEFAGPKSKLNSTDLNSALLSTYDIKADDARMREAMAVAKDEERAGAFDLLRKRYPVRREPSHFELNLGALERAGQEKASATALGFACYE